jgi:predicted MFS family arabinose efflux permease
MLIWLLSAGNFVIGMGAFVVIGMLAPIAEGFGISTAQAGLVLTVFALAYAVCSPLGVAATGAWSRRRVLSTGLGLFGVAALLCALAPTPEILFAGRALAALGAGLFTPNASAVAVSTSPSERQGTALSNVLLGLTLAQVLGVPAGSVLAYAFGWQAGFLAVAVLAAPVLFGLWRLVPADLAFQPTEFSSLRTAMKDIRTLVAVLFATTFLAAIYVPYTYLGPLLTEKMGFEGGGVAMALLVFGSGAVAGNLIGGRLSDWIGAERMLLALAIAQILLLSLLSLLPLPAAAVFALIFVWSLCSWSFLAPQQAILVRLAPERQSVTLALNAAAIYVGAAAGSAIGAVALAQFGPGSLGMAGGALGFVALGNVTLALRLARE